MKAKEEILNDHFQRISNKTNRRAPLRTKVTLITQAALLAMEEYKSQFTDPIKSL